MQLAQRRIRRCRSNYSMESCFQKKWPLLMGSYVLSVRNQNIMKTWGHPELERKKNVERLKKSQHMYLEKFVKFQLFEYGKEVRKSENLASFKKKVNESANDFLWVEDLVSLAGKTFETYYEEQKQERPSECKIRFPGYRWSTVTFFRSLAKAKMFKYVCGKVQGKAKEFKGESFPLFGENDDLNVWEEFLNFLHKEGVFLDNSPVWKELVSLAEKTFKEYYTKNPGMKQGVTNENRELIALLMQDSE